MIHLHFLQYDTQLMNEESKNEGLQKFGDFNLPPELYYSISTVYVCDSCSGTDTAVKLAATKVVAAEANATAIDVLERLGDLNLQLHGLQRNYSELEDTVNTANQMIQDPQKNSKVPSFT